MRNQTITKDVENKQLTVKRSFAASRDRLWAAWSDADLLSQWWGPRDWPTTTKSFDFSPGGHWHYCMTGPDGTEAWGWVDYRTVNAPESFTAEDSFADADGNKTNDLPHTQWKVEFSGDGEDGPTMLITTLTFTTEADLKKIVEMGFEAGYSESLDKLEEQLTAEQQ